MATTPAGIPLTSVTHCEQTDEYRATYDTEQTTPAMAVVAAVACARSVPAETLRPIYNSIDTDGLNSVLGEPVVDSATVSFSFEGYAVTVSGEGLIELSHVDPDI